MIKTIFPDCKQPDEVEAAFNMFASQYKIDTPIRKAHFFAQVGHESGHFNLTKENLNYSSKGLLGVFKKYFTPELAEQFARQPEKIANRVYANRMGNGDEASGDGYRYRGRGFIQLTGKDNYAAFAEDTGKDVVASPEYLETVEGAMHSACWFWNKNKLYEIADSDDIQKMTKRVNGGLNGIEERTHILIIAKQVLGV